MMEHRILEINLQYAKDLNKVNLLTKMDVYAVVSVAGGGNNTIQRVKTPPDHGGDDNPTWDFPIKLKIDEGEMKFNRLTLAFKLVCKRALGDKVVGEVQIPIKELLDTQAKGSGADGRVFVSYQVRKPDGKPKGQISFSYKFSEKLAGAVGGTAPPYASGVPNPPVTAYPVGSSSVYPPQGTYPPYNKADESGGYPPATAYSPAAGYGYGYEQPAAAGYGYPPPPPPGYPYPGQGGYGYGYAQPPPVVQPAPRRNNIGLGLGAGLLGGALGGLLIGDMIGDAGGFDFGDGGFGF